MKAQINCNQFPIFNVIVTNNQTLNSTILNNATVRFIGNTTVNGTVTLNDCNVLIDPGSTVNVTTPPGALQPTVFTINGTGVNGATSIVQGCGSMWNSIQVNAGAAIRLTNTIISDGLTGISLNSGFLGGTSSIVGCTFQNNRTAITAVDPTNFNPYPVSLQTFSGNTFLGQTPNAAFLPPFSAPQPLVAIRLNTVTGSIGTAGAQNTFSGFSAAVFMTSASAVTLNNCRFINNNYQDWNGIPVGVGIWSDNSTLTVSGAFSNGFSCEFFGNSRCGIRSSGTRGLTVRNARFGDVPGGLGNQAIVDVEVIGSNRPNRVTINDNLFNVGTPTQNSLFVERAAQAMGTNTQVRNNQIFLPNPVVGQQLGNNLRIFELTARAGATDQAVVADNVFTITYGGANLIDRQIDGIVIGDGNAGILGGDNNQVSGNQISYQMPVAPAPVANGVHSGFGIGLLVNNGVGNIIGPNNSMTSTNFPAAGVGADSWLRCGVHIESSPNVSVCTNTSTDCQFDFHLIRNCMMGEWGRNTMSGGRHGLNIFNLVYPNQDYRMNNWAPGAIWNGPAAQVFGALPAGSTWLTDNTNPNNGYFPPTQNQILFAAFPNNQQSLTGCDGVLPPPPFGGEEEEAKRFVSGVYSFGTNAEAWDYERALLERMIRFPVASFSDAAVENWYASHSSGSSIWQHANAAELLESAFRLKENEENSIRQLIDRQSEDLDRLSQIEVEEGADLNSFDAALQASKNTLLNELGPVQTALKNASDAIASRQIADAQEAASFIAELPTATVFEADNKLILRLKALANMDIAWSESDWATLRELADDCVSERGDAVFNAREMLPAPERFSFSYEAEHAGCSHDRSKSIPSDAFDNDLNIVPNPSSDAFEAVFAAPFTGKIELLDLNGRVLTNTTVVNALRHIFKVDVFSSGIYWVKTTDQNARIRVAKAVISN